MPTLMPISVIVTMPGLRLVLRCTFWTTRAAPFGWPEWSGQRIPTGGKDHAVGADPAPALGAGDARLAVWVPVAPEELGHPV